jgi:ferric-dicitrate binding protein FerR (iron transport regulator)
MKHVTDLIPAYLDGRLDEAGRADVRAHCEACPECRRALAESEAVWGMLDDLQAPGPARPAWAGVAAALSARREPAWRRTAFAGLAAAALVAGVLVGTRQYSPAIVTPDYAGEILSGSLLAGEETWTLDAALETFIADAGEDEEG